MGKTSNKTKATPCPRCGRQVTHRTAKQKAVCALNEAAVIAREGFAFDIDSRSDPRVQVVFEAPY